MRDTKKLMKQFNEKHFHKGFYINHMGDLDEISFEELMGYESDEEIGVYNASQLLHGVCYLFSYALHEVFDYDAFAIMNNDILVHTFCRSQYENRPVYIDARGATTSFDEFLQGFVMDSVWSIERQHLDEVWEDRDMERYAFAKQVIRRYMSYYE